MEQRRHVPWETVRVHDEVGADPSLREGEVLLLHYRPAHALLAVPAGELVAHFRPSRVAHEGLDHELVLVVRGEQHLVDDRALASRALVGLGGGLEEAAGRGGRFCQIRLSDVRSFVSFWSSYNMELIEVLPYHTLLLFVLVALGSACVNVSDLTLF
jgi:hypothetical protein